MNEWAILRRYWAFKQAYSGKKHSEQISHSNNFISCLVNYNILYISTFHCCVKNYHTLSSLGTWRHRKSAQHHREWLRWTGIHPPNREALNMWNLRKITKFLFMFSPWGNYSVQTDEDEIIHPTSYWLLLFFFIFMMCELTFLFHRKQRRLELAVPTVSDGRKLMFAVMLAVAASAPWKPVQVLTSMLGPLEGHC